MKSCNVIAAASLALRQHRLVANAHRGRLYSPGAFASRACSSDMFIKRGIGGLIEGFRYEGRTSSWAFYGLLYAGIFFTTTTIGIAATAVYGPWEGAEEARNNKRPPRKPIKLTLQRDVE